MLESSNVQTANAQWGFLKNIVNINTFFATGPPHKTASKRKQQQPVDFNSFVQEKSQPG